MEFKVPRRTKELAKSELLEATIAIARERGLSRVTVEAVAQRARCAKGLVLYHFKSRSLLLEAMIFEVLRRRQADWSIAFGRTGPTAVIDATWNLLTIESANGTARLFGGIWSHAAEITDQLASNALISFAAAISHGAAQVLRSHGLRAGVEIGETGWLLTAVILGTESALSNGADPGELEGAYTRAWLALLELVG